VNDVSLNVRITNLGAFREALRLHREDTEHEIEAYLKVELNRAKDRLESATPIKTGRMESSWRVELNGFREGKVTNTAPYATFLFTGTRPHAIPRAFGFPLPFGTSPTFHPGTRRNQELIRALDTSARNAREHFAQVGGKVANTFARRTLAHGDTA